MRAVLLVLALAVLALLMAACAEIPRSSPMPEGPPTAAPIGWVEFCVRHPEADRCFPR